MHVAPANNSGKCMMNYDSEILCRDNGMRNCGPQPYLKIFQNIFRVVLVDGGKRLAIAPCHAHLLMTANFRPYISISISSVLGCCRKSDQRVVLTPYLARPVILYAHVFSTTKPLEVKNGVFDDICGREASSICT